MASERETLLREISALYFAIIDMNLYLDSHVESASITKKIAEHESRLYKLKNEYESKYGALESNDTERNRWSWISDPWPWDNIEEGE